MANGNIVVRILGDDSQFKRTVSGLGKAASVAVKGLAVAGGVLSAAWTAVGLTSVKYNAEIEQLQTSFKVMTGSADKAANVMERLRKLGATTPFATKDLAAATQLLMQYGFNADDAINSMTMLGDISQGNSEKMMSIATAYGQMTSAGKVNLQDIKQMINAGFNPLQEITEKTGESMESLYDRISKGTMAVSEITDAMRSATSEGGKFFGSMEAQSQTVSGLLSTLKDELQTLGGDIFEPVSEALRSKVLPEAIRIVQEMQNAYGKGGFDGLIDSLTAEIPKLLDGATAAIEKVVVKLKAKLPGIIKKLISALPSILAASADSIIPTLVDTIFDVVSVAVEELVGKLPELVPILLRGVLNLVKSVATGIWDVVTGLFNGLDTAMKKMGLLSLTPMEAFEQAWENADTSQIKDVDVKVGVNITAEDYQTEIDDALNTVRTALQNTPGLTEEQKTAIETAIINGTGIDLINQTLADMGVPETKAAEITTAITTARDTIQTTLEGLGLSQDAINAVAAVAAEGGNVQAALESYNIDSTKASAAATTINTAMTGIETAAAGLGLDDTTVRSMKLGAVQDKIAIETALRMLGVDETVITEITGSYDTLSGSLTAGIRSIYSQIATEFTNGIPEDDETVAAAKSKVMSVYDEAQKRLDEWYAAAMADLETKGLSGAALESERDRITGTYNEISTGLETTTTTLLAQTEDMVGKSKEYCEGQLEIISGTIDQLDDFTARIDVLTNEQYDTARTRRRLVQEGVVTNEQHQYEAMALTAEELAERLQVADAEAAAAYEEAAKNLGENSEAYKARAEEIASEYAQAQGIAYDIYNAEMAKIIAGIVKSSPDLAAAFENFASEQEAKNMALKLQSEIANAVNQAAMTGEGVSLDAFLEGLTAEGIDLSSLASSLNLDAGQLTEMIATALKSPDADTMLNSAIVDYVDGIESDLSTALQGAGIDATAIPAIKKALEDGYLQTAGEMDWTNFETILSTMLSSTMSNTSTQITAEQGNIETAIGDTVSGAAGAVDATDDGKSVGQEMGNGIAEGIKGKRALVVAQARALAVAAKNAMENVLQIASPSKVTKRLGGFFGEGFALGIEGQIGSANRAAQRMADSAIGTIDAIGNNMNLSQQANAGGMASAFQTMLSSMNLATDNGQPVQLFVNGRLVAETIKRDIAQTQAGYNMDIARGVGKA